MDTHLCVRHNDHKRSLTTPSAITRLRPAPLLRSLLCAVVYEYPGAGETEQLRAARDVAGCLFAGGFISRHLLFYRLTVPYMVNVFLLVPVTTTY